ncbi:MAG: Multisubunit Na+/H+ antiporter MnhF subunit [Candidatus Methanohalarchaeum thermophilum]|uniref:Multisubunit Na+/H+ antiporter MnhF subunit n=1 Tax=Methanohalarchaeum thermophilum TaxID=1903181 RepID=A0A1Q6DUQ2_METT1|nr:MAG: Multisubunit Na+/H+ antiporter MnhF subunit [Candidatus Methanohalarchaeum thermophilum]
MIDLAFTVVSIFLMSTTLLVIYRAIIGPTFSDRLVAVNMVGTTTLVVLVLIGYIYHQPIFVDISLTYALLNFIVILAVGVYLEEGKIF